MDKWPLYFKELMFYGNPESNVGLITLWTKTELFLKNIEKENYNIAGQLYSKNNGINILIRNLLANKKITALVIVGDDLNKSGETVRNLFYNGIDENRRIIGSENSKIDDDIPLDSIEELRKYVEVHFFVDKYKLNNTKELNKALSEINKNKKTNECYTEPEIYKKLEIEKKDKFYSEKSNFVIRENYIKDAWLKVLSDILRFGTLKNSEYEQKQLELIDVIIEIDKEDANNPKLADYFDFDKQELDEYIKTVTTPYEKEGLSYTYGKRLMNFYGIDQIKLMISKLKESSHSRRAISFCWDIREDSKNKNPPCLNLVQAIIQDDELFLIAYFRSNDMYGAWPKNAFALRALQQNIADELQLKAGKLITISASAHIYEDSIKRAEKIVKKNKNESSQRDPRGNLLIYIDREKAKIILDHLSPDGELIDEIEGETAEELAESIISGEKISQLSHAIYLGQELMKAEIALKKGIDYVQDREIKF
jgi:thymidylate synthase